MEQRPNLFDQQPAAAPKPVDVAVVAAQIAENAPRVEYPDRTSAAAEDQGWGSVILPEITLVDSVVSEEQHEALPTRPKARLELPGKNGLRNPGTQTPTRAEAQQGMTAEQIAHQNHVNKVGAAAARAALRAASEARG